MKQFNPCVATALLVCAFPCLVFTQNFNTDTAKIRQLITFCQTSKADEILLLHNGRPV